MTRFGARNEKANLSGASGRGQASFRLGWQDQNHSRESSQKPASLNCRYLHHIAFVSMVVHNHFRITNSLMTDLIICPNCDANSVPEGTVEKDSGEPGQRLWRLKQSKTKKEVRTCQKSQTGPGRTPNRVLGPAPGWAKDAERRAQVDDLSQNVKWCLRLEGLGLRFQNLA